MRASVELIQALRRAATRIEDPNGGYSWFSASQCNCGILAEECGIPSRKIQSSAFATWNKMAACESTGHGMDEIFSALEMAGIERPDFMDIEYAENKAVLRRLGEHDRTQEARRNDKKNPRFVARYFRAQADILEEELTNLRQCGVESRHAVQGGLVLKSLCQTVETIPEQARPRVPGRMGESKIEDSPSSAGPLPQSPSQPVACVHMWCGHQCLYCCALEPVQQKELV